MDGKPLYEYARQNLPLPKPIEARNCTIYNLELVDFKNGDEHSWTGAKEEMSQEEKDTISKLESLVKSKELESGDAASQQAVTAAVPEASETEGAQTDEKAGLSDSKTEGESMMTTSKSLLVG